MRRLNCTWQSVIRGSVLEPGGGSANPFEQVRREAFILLHQPLVILINLEDFADTIGRSLRLYSWMVKSLKMLYLLITSKAIWIEHIQQTWEGSHEEQKIRAHVATMIHQYETMLGFCTLLSKNAQIQCCSAHTKT